MYTVRASTSCVYSCMHAYTCLQRTICVEELMHKDNTYVYMCVCIHVFAGECQDQEGQGASGGRRNCDRTTQDSQRRRPPIIRGPLGLVCSLIHFMKSGHESQSSPARRHSQRRRPRIMICHSRPLRAAEPRSMSLNKEHICVTCR